MTTFIRKLEAAWQANNSLLCVGLDPDLKRFPAHLVLGDRAQFGRRLALEAVEHFHLDPGVIEIGPQPVVHRR